MRQYYQNDENLCFPTSLANLLMHEGEPGLADKVYSGYSTSKLALPDGTMPPIVAPLLVAELTEGKYSATLYMRTQRDQCIDELKKYYPNDYKDISDRLDKEIEAGHVKPFEIPITEPHLLLVRGGSRELSHWLVNLDWIDFIDDGRRENYTMKELGPFGALTLVKNR